MCETCIMKNNNKKNEMCGPSHYASCIQFFEKKYLNRRKTVFKNIFVDELLLRPSGMVSNINLNVYLCTPRPSWGRNIYGGSSGNYIGKNSLCSLCWWQSGLVFSSVAV